MSAPVIAAHQHCEICGKVVAVETRFCSTECEARHDEAQSYKKRQMWILLAIVVGILLVFRILPLIG